MIECSAIRWISPLAVMTLTITDKAFVPLNYDDDNWTSYCGKRAR